MMLEYYYSVLIYILKKFLFRYYRTGIWGIEDAKYGIMIRHQETFTL